MQRETTVGEDHAERLAAIEEQLVAEEASLAKLKTQWEQEVDLVRQIRAMREALETGAETVKADGDGESGVKASLEALRALEERTRGGPGRESAYARVRG